MSWTTWILFFFIIGFLMIGAELAKSDINYGVERDIYNYTEEKIVMPDINISEIHPVERTTGVINIGRMYKILDSYVTFILISTGEVMKMGVEYGYQNPHINFRLIFKYLIYIMIAILIFFLIKPLSYLIVFIIFIVMTIIEWRRNKKKDMVKYIEKKKVKEEPE